MKAGPTASRRRPKQETPAEAQAEAEVSDLEAGLKEEIATLRRFMRRLLALSGEVDSLEDARKDLGALSLAAIRLATLMKAQQDLKTPDGDLETLLLQALTDTIQEIREKDVELMTKEDVD